MTIKPVTVPASSKRAVTNNNSNNNNNEADKDSQNAGADQNRETIGQSTVNRTSTSLRNAIDTRGMSPQRRVEVYDELARHRCSPHKSVRPKRRDLHEHNLKRERTEREKLSNILPTSSTGAHSSAIASAVSGVNNNNRSVSPTNLNLNVNGTDISVKTTKHNCPSPQSPQTNVEDKYSGYNSGDEHYHSRENSIPLDEWKRRDEQFEKCMAERGYVVKPVEEDGACLFRAISLQIYGDEGMHDVIRQHTMDYIYKNREYFCNFVTEDINNYIKRKRRIDSHGNHIEIQAMSEIYSRPVEVYCYKPTPINIFNSEQLANGYPPLRLSYQRGSHYNAIIDPYNATVGVGLGLAGYKPELQTKEALRLSEQLEIEQTMFEDKLKTTDWEATNEAIEEQIARESYLQWCRDSLQRSRGATTSTIASASATVTSTTANSNNELLSTNFLEDSISSTSATTLHNISALKTFDDLSAAGGDSIIKSGTANLVVSSNVDNDNDSGQLLNESSLTALSKIKDSSDGGSVDSDTDVSTTSSIENLENVSPSFSGRSRKNKTRVGNMNTGKKRRKEHINSQAAIELKDTTNVRFIKSDDLTCASTSSTIPVKKLNESQEIKIDDAEQLPCTSKQLQGSDKSLTKDGNSIDASDDASSSSTRQPQISSFYQELLQASFAGFGELSEAEMLQQAIQMSTQEYIDDLKRKY